MMYTASEKLAIIRLVEETELSVRITLTEIKVSRSSFYRWYAAYEQDGKTGIFGIVAGEFRRDSGGLALKNAGSGNQGTSTSTSTTMEYPFILPILRRTGVPTATPDSVLTGTDINSPVRSLE
ncbi:MAG: hypothetical protein EXR84_11605 [Gammaproteobacteria bacterium]|nr:hypothetical protein [Gammaproteobacteria bacterium]